MAGQCAATIGLLYGGQSAALIAVCIVWGISIVADSAQFSAAIAELADRARVGTMLTLQTALGFTLTLVTIHLMPHFVAAMGWRYAFVPLAIGPAIGVWAMARLRTRPEAVSAFERGLPPGLTCHPYDVCCALIAEACGVIVTDAYGRTLDAPLNVEADVAWVGYANAGIRAQIEPALQHAMRERGLLD